MKEITDENVVQMTAEAKKHLEAFKIQFVDSAKRIMSDINASYLPFIESDAWTNYRQHLQDCMEQEYMQNSRDVRTSEQLWAKNIRTRILDENREELIQGIIRDQLAQIEQLKEQLNQRRSNFF